MTSVPFSFSKAVMPDAGSTLSPGWARASAFAALLVVCFGVFAMLQAPLVPYADAWRFLAHFLSEPFPGNVLGADNGHLELFPDLVRVAELEWFAANQCLQTAVGMGLALASWLVAVQALRGDAREPARFWAVGLVLALGLFWLGNFRALMHANETVHAYAVTLGLFAGIALATRGGAWASVAAALCAVFASLSFGSGLAVFPALMLVLALRRAPWREWLPMAVALVGVVLLMLSLRDGTTRTLIAIDGVARAEALLRWLGGPALYASWPLWDPEIAARVPTALLREATQPLAVAYEQAAGPVLLARWPHLAWGLIGAGVFAWSLLRSWRKGGGLALIGTATAAFALCVGALIVLVRASYFEQHPDQLLAPRYLVWTSLFWMGLGLVLLDALKPTRGALLALVTCVLLLPSQLWMYRVGEGQRETAERTAVAAAVGIIEPDFALGETELKDLVAALPLLREARASVFAWPEVQRLDQVAAPAGLGAIEVHALRVEVVDNRLGAPGRRVEFMAPQGQSKRLLLIDADGVARGLARREPDGRWLGWMAAAAPASGIRVAAVIEP